MFKKTINYFDKLEDRIRSKLSHHPIVYSFIGGVAIVLFWRGVWMTADQYEFLTGPVSVLISVSILLMSGLFASFFVSNRIILSGLTREKKLTEKTEAEVKEELATLVEVKDSLKEIKETLTEIKEADNKN